MAIGPTLQEARLKKQLTPSQVAEMTRMKVQLVEDLENDDFHRIAATIYGKGFIKLFAECVGLDPKPLITDYVRSVEGDTPSLIPDGSGPSVAPEAPASPPEGAPVEEETPTETEMPEEEMPEEETLEEEPAETEEADLFAFASSKRKRIVPDRPTQQPSAVKTAISEKAGAAGDAIKRGGQTVANACRRAGETLGNRLADIRWGDAPLKVIGVVIGILVVLLFVVSVISNCAGRHGDRAGTDDMLQLAVDPPEPYFD
jgi:transcriptional regulator with XRE-family HTH domain